MTTEIKVPVLPESVADASVATWHVKVGDKVSRDQNLVDIETDKVVLEVVSPEDGVITEILEDEGATVLGEQVIARVGASDAAPAADASPAKEESAKSSTSSQEKQVVKIKVPVLPESVADATIATWHVQEGDSVERDQNLVDIETDKVVLEVVAPEAGVISKILHGEGDTVLGEQEIAEVTAGGTSAPSSESSNEETSSASGDEVMSPSVRRLVSEKGLDASKIKGSGKNGKITKEDVEAFATKASAPAKSAPAAQPAVQVASGDRTQKRVPMTRLRKTIANRLLEAKNSTAMLTTFNEINMKPIMDLRKQYKDVFEERHGARLGFMSFYVKAVVEALKRFPAVNASIDGDDIVYHNYFDVSIAVSTPRGLVTPVLRDCDKMNFAEIENGIRELAIKGRDGKLTVEEMQGGNFTITNGGVFGSLLSTPIINLPQTAILGMHKIQDRPMAVNGKVEILPMMYLALSYDHRLVDGKESVGFLVTVKELLEDPARLLLDI
ncbi:2-oxoglutarate dehydrogenase complex dihydrolipoyllysine-residue succinyltransferase [Psychrosphaera aestuarii]|uniref:2-oxoglutarate dehydrogenase complex dihydrolipoyllysine-residue succinyltransferase n=1 Tax=Psychrosphaera aestuarii TaxID=1266052 RepID=UPI001B330F98|nr:2-oxoglutarate dehydrogenase complex dihydrolipoyllysine-residue succinyltransferase [Psychrosphaera aestuarii]